MSQPLDTRNPGVEAGVAQDAFANGGEHQINNSSKNYSQARPIDLILSRMEGVKSFGNNYRARCPACGGTASKVSVTECETGALLLHCFGGCVAAEVLGAVGLNMSDLFPTRLRPQNASERRNARERARIAGWQAALSTLPIEITIVQIAGKKLQKLSFLTDEDDARLNLAVERIADAQAVLCPAATRFRLGG